MSIHLSQVYDYLDAHPVSRYPEDFSSLLDMIHYIYTENNPIDSARIRGLFREVQVFLDRLSLAEQDQVLNLTSQLCLEHEQEAFAHGILVGLCLMSELNGLP